MKTKAMKIAAAGAAAIAMAWFAAGCGDDVETDTALAITPVKAELASKGSTLVLTAFDPDQGVYDYSPSPDQYTEKRGGKAVQDPSAPSSTNLSSAIFLPLEWSVSDPALGRIAASAGYSAVYESWTDGHGQNIVTVRDQVERTGIAVVNHVVPTETNKTAATP